MRKRARHCTRIARAHSPRDLSDEEEELRVGRLLYPEKFTRPRTRGECENGIRPCPYVGCRHHLALDVRPTGSIVRTKLPLASLPATCSLDVAEDGGRSLRDVAPYLELTQEGVRQVEVAAIAKLKKRAPELVQYLQDMAPEPAGEVVRRVGGRSRE